VPKGAFKKNRYIVTGMSVLGFPASKLVNGNAELSQLLMTGAIRSPRIFEIAREVSVDVSVKEVSN
jgi:hypothetical protein